MMFWSQFVTEIHTLFHFLCMSWINLSFFLFFFPAIQFCIWHNKNVSTTVSFARRTQVLRNTHRCEALFLSSVSVTAWLFMATESVTAQRGDITANTGMYGEVERCSAALQTHTCLSMVQRYSLPWSKPSLEAQGCGRAHTRGVSLPLHPPACAHAVQ